jgi:hypothetical protein
MKKLFLSLALFWGICTFAMAQKGERVKNKMESYRVAYISEKLDLSAEEAQRFWPIYNQFRDKMKEVRKDSRPEKLLADMTEAEAETLVNNSFEKDEKELSLKREYVKKLKGVIPAKKIALLQNVEQDFKKEVLQRVKDRKEGRNED